MNQGDIQVSFLLRRNPVFETFKARVEGMNGVVFRFADHENNRKLIAEQLSQLIAMKSEWLPKFSHFTEHPLQIAVTNFSANQLVSVPQT
jgi:hypothetical protein